MEKAMSNGDEWEIDVCLVNNEGNVWSVQSPDYPFKCKYAPIWSLVYCKCTLTKVEGGSRSGWWRVVIRSELKMRNKGKSCDPFFFGNWVFLVHVRVTAFLSYLLKRNMARHRSWIQVPKSVKALVQLPCFVISLDFNQPLSLHTIILAANTARGAQQ